MAVNVYKFTPQSPEWLAKRCENVTATEVAALLGVCKYSTPNKVLKQKQEPSLLKDNQFMRAGRILESGVFVALKEIGVNCRPADYENVVMYVNEDIHLSCTLDGIGKSKSGEIFVVECKSTNPKLFPGWLDMIPVNYNIQIQVQMMLSGCDMGLIACLNQEFPFNLIVYKVEANRYIQEIVTETVKKFWTCVKEDVKFKVDRDNIIKIIESLISTSELIYG